MFICLAHCIERSCNCYDTKYQSQTLATCIHLLKNRRIINVQLSDRFHQYETMISKKLYTYIRLLKNICLNGENLANFDGQMSHCKNTIINAMGQTSFSKVKI